MKLHTSKNDHVIPSSSLSDLPNTFICIQLCQFASSNVIIKSLEYARNCLKAFKIKTTSNKQYIKIKILKQ